MSASTTGGSESRHGVLDGRARHCPALAASGGTVLGLSVWWVTVAAGRIFDDLLSDGGSGWAPSLNFVWLGMVVGAGGLLALLAAFIGAAAGLANPRRRSGRPMVVWLTVLALSSPLGVGVVEIAVNWLVLHA